jgi:hypothetical protein
VATRGAELGGTGRPDESIVIFLLKNKSENQLSREICKEAPRFLCNQVAVHENSKKTPGFQNISKNTPSHFPEITKKTPQLLLAISSQP